MAILLNLVKSMFIMWQFMPAADILVVDCAGPDAYADRIDDDALINCMGWISGSFGVIETG